MRRLSRLSRRAVHLLLMEAVLLAIWAFPLQMTIEDIDALRTAVMTPTVERVIEGVGLHPDSFWTYDIEALVNTGFEPLTLKENLAKGILLLALLAWVLSHLARASSQQANRIMRRRLIWLLAAMSALTASLVLGTRDGQAVWLQARAFFTTLSGIAFLFMVGDLVRTRRRAVQWIALLMLAMVPAMLVSVVQHLGDVLLPPERYSWLWVIPIPGSEHARNAIGSLIGHNNGIALLAVPGLLALPWLWRRSRSTAIRVALVLWAVLAIWVVIRAQSRSVYLSTATACVVMVWLSRRVRVAAATPRGASSVRRWLMAAVILVLLTQVVPNPLQGTTGLAGRLKRLVDWSDLMTDTRMRTLVTGAPAFLDRPLIGWGIGSFPHVYPKYQGAYFNDPAHADTPLHPTSNLTQRAHNDWLQLAMEMGVVGLAVALWCLCLWGRRAWRHLHGRCPPEDRGLLIALIGGAVLFAVQAGLDFPMHVMPSALAALFFLAALGNAPEICGPARFAQPAAFSLRGERRVRWILIGLLLVWAVWPPRAWFGPRRDFQPTRLAPSLATVLKPIVGEMMADARKTRAEAHILQYFEEAPGRGPGNIPAAQRWLGDALARMREAHAIAQSNGPVLNRLGEVYHHLGVLSPENHRAAIEFLARGLREQTAYTGYHYIGESHYELSRHADREAREAQARGEAREAERLRERSQEHLVNAVRAYERALAINPTDTHSAWNMSVILRRIGREDLADEPLRPLVRWEPAWYRQRLIEPMLETIDLGQSHEALGRLEFLREIEPENPLYVALRAEVYLRLGEAAQARQAISLLEEQFPEEPFRSQLEIELALLEGRLEEAAAMARERREAAPVQHLALEVIALRGLQRDDEANEARAALRAAVQASGQPVEVADRFLGDFAWNYLRDRDLAERYYLRIADEPLVSTPLLHHRLASRAAERGERERALALLDRIAEPFEPAETLRQTLLQEEP